MGSGFSFLKFWLFQTCRTGKIYWCDCVAFDEEITLCMQRVLVQCTWRVPFCKHTSIWGWTRSLYWWRYTDISMPALKGLSQLLVLLFSVPFDLLQLFLCKINFKIKKILFDLVYIFYFSYKHCQCGQMKRGKKQMTILFVSKQKILFCGIECCLSCWSN